MARTGFCWIVLMVASTLSCHTDRPRGVEPVVAPKSTSTSASAKASTSSAAAAERGKISMCFTNSSFESLGRLRFRLLDGDRVVHKGETNDAGCMERHGLPLGNYVMELDGYDPLGAMLLDEDDPEPLVRTPSKKDGASP